MSVRVRGVAASRWLWPVACLSWLLSVAAVAQDKQAAMSERAKVSYMVGADVGRSIAQVGPDLDVAAFERAMKNAFAGAKPLLSDEESQTVGRALMQRIGERSGKSLPGVAPGTKAPPVDKTKVGFLVGTVAACVLGERPPVDLAPFGSDRPATSRSSP